LGEILTLKLRYKLPDERKSKLITTTVENKWVSYARSSTNFKWSAAVAGFGMLLRDSKFKGSLNYEDIHESGRLATGRDKNGDRAECLKLMETAQLLSEAKNKLTADEK
jgi:Ca-activated chloride channel homolog